MTKLLITEITYMGPFHCVIGLKRDNGKIYSVRPIAPVTNGWRFFPYQRGDILLCNLIALSGAKPHVEDQLATREFRKETNLADEEVVKYLKRAEYSNTLRELFGCAIHENKSGSGLFVKPNEAKRSICGTETRNLTLELVGNELRATVALPSGEVLRDLPVVDRDWRDFVEAALAEQRGSNRMARLDRFLKSHFHCKVLSCAHHFVRLGLTRAYHDVCWLMLDTLFPLPQAEWLEEF